MSLPALPNEILSLICEFSVLSYLQPDRRLYISSSRCYSCGTTRQVFPCPPALLVNSAFRDTGTRCLYRHAFIVVQFDHLCLSKDPATDLINRRTILPLIHNLEFFIRRCGAIEARLLRSHDPETLCRPNSPPCFTFSELNASLPNLKQVAWTVGVWGNHRLHIPLTDPTRPNSQRLPAGFNSLSSILTYKRIWTQRITRFRIWFPQNTTKELCDLTYRRTSNAPTKQELEGLVESLRTHAFIKPLTKLPNLESLDLFFYTYVSSVSNHRPPGSAIYPVRTLVRPLRESYLPPVEAPQLHSLSFAMRKERDEMETLLKTLRLVFANLPTVNFWRIRYGHVMNNAYEKIEFA
ncbi:hypothetical protein B0A52_08088 [Exophiala mesophila]|uniref:Uncharacterized protein n=1 Tax=Exophiala mesophila TaxID=212818 RepID=A0A438N010_EXOME|nr:hypothetical protein B0A52_08088 [Exophiala mesophila]